MRPARGRDRNSRTLWQSDSGTVGLVKDTPSIVTTLDDDILTTAATSFSSIVGMVKSSKARSRATQAENEARQRSKQTFEAKEREKKDAENREKQREQMLFDGLGFDNSGEGGGGKRGGKKR